MRPGPGWKASIAPGRAATPAFGAGVAALVLLVLAAASPSLAGPAARDSLGSPLSLSTRDVAVLGTGAVLGGLGAFVLEADVRTVPPAGLDRNAIHLGWDRRAIDTPDPGALSASNVTLGASVILPAVFGLAFPTPEGRKPGFLRLGTTGTEAAILALGGAQFAKSLIGRPRPYTYLPEAERPAGDRYDTGRVEAFESMPSGHATLAWTAAMTGVGYLASRRPDLPGWVHFLGGAAAGGLATSTSLLRVQGQGHFPSDVVAGSLWGGTAGTAVVLLRGGPAAPGDRGKAWLRSLLGVAAGSALALLLTPPTSPWID